MERKNITTTKTKPINVNEFMEAIDMTLEFAEMVSNENQ